MMGLAAGKAPFRLQLGGDHKNKQTPDHITCSTYHALYTMEDVLWSIEQFSWSIHMVDGPQNMLYGPPNVLPNMEHAS